MRATQLVRHERRK